MVICDTDDLWNLSGFLWNQIGRLFTARSRRTLSNITLSIIQEEEELMSRLIIVSGQCLKGHCENQTALQGER